MIYAESTPNPASIKFVSNKMLVHTGASFEFQNVAHAKHSPLARKLFEFPFVKIVFISANYVTITRHDFVHWDDILLETRSFISNFLNEKGIIFESEILVGNPVDSSENMTAPAHPFSGHATPKNESEAKIIEVLEQYIRPSVEQDGGMISFQSLKDGVVTVQMKGSCSGCPSSTMTLKAGIEGLLKKLLPDEVKEVVSAES